MNCHRDRLDVLKIQRLGIDSERDSSEREKKNLTRRINSVIIIEENEYLASPPPPQMKMNKTGSPQL